MTKTLEEIEWIKAAAVKIVAKRLKIIALRLKYVAELRSWEESLEVYNNLANELQTVLDVLSGKGELS